MQKFKITPSFITKVALISAIYTALVLVSAPISFGPVQFRISEILTVLPVFTPVAIPGLTLGCFLSNLIGLLMGENPLGVADIFIGTAATFLSAVSTYYIGKRCKKWAIYAFAPLPAVVINAVLIGLELAFVFTPQAFFVGFLTNATWVFVGQFAVCYIPGEFVLYKLYQNNNYKKIFK